jgi:hypothetical protein
LLDAQGNVVGTLRIRKELSGTKVPFFVWSSPLHARVFISTRPQQPSACELGLHILFDSLHVMVFGIIPSGERLGLTSNGKLEIGYLDAIQSSN